MWPFNKGACKKEEERLSTKACSDRSRGDSFKLEKIGLGFLLSVVTYGNRLHRKAVNAASLEMLKVKLDSTLI